MIPRTFPSSVASNGSAQMIVYFLPSVSGLTRWVDYIPVKFTTVATAATENTYNQNGYIPVVSISSITGATPFKEYVPVYLDSSATDAEVWKVNVTGFIPVGTAGIGGAALYMDFAATTTLDPRITFSRTTNATLTNSAGLVAYAPHNLLTYSEQFDNAAWVKSNTTVTANTVVAPDGTATADKLIANTTSIEHLCRGTLTLSATTHTLSVYAKAGEYSWVVLTGVSFANAKASFNLSAGTVGTVSGSGSPAASISNAGNGWFRCVLTFTASASSASYGIAMANGNDSTFFAGDGVSGIYLWGAQLEIGSTATTYNPTTVKNLLGYTEHFDNAAWTKSNASITSGFTDIYGQPFAQKLVESAAGSHYIFGNVVTFAASTPYVFSFYAKAGERTVAQVVPPGTFGSTLFANFDLANGVVGSVGGGQQATITPVGNGWYRCAVYNTASVATQAYTIGTVTSASSVRLEAYTGDGTSGIYIFGAQLSDSASIDPYVYNPVAAPTAQAYYGPRFDYDPVTLAPKGLLIEEQRTNLVLQSETFDNAYWGKTNATVTANTVVSPDGMTDAETLSDGVAAGLHYIESTAQTLTGAHTASIYAKKGTSNFIGLYAQGLSQGVFFNLNTGAFSSNIVGAPTSYSIAAVGNGWYRCTITFTAAATSLSVRLFTSTDGTTFNYTGNNNTVFIWGAQLEAGAFTTSYIPTVASQVTRAADSASMIGNNFARWYNVSAGTLYAQFSIPANRSNMAIWQINESTNARWGLNVITDNTFSYDFFTGSAGSQSGFVAGVSQKVSVAIKSGSTPSEAANGVVSTSVGSLAAFPSNTSTLYIGSRAADLKMSGTIARIAFYSRQLSPAEQQGITA